MDPINTYYIADNKAKQGAIYQTRATREEMWLMIENRVDIVMAADDTEDAQNMHESTDNELVPFDTFVR